MSGEGKVRRIVDGWLEGSMHMARALACLGGMYRAPTGLTMDGKGV